MAQKGCIPDIVPGRQAREREPQDIHISSPFSRFFFLRFSLSQRRLNHKRVLFRKFSRRRSTESTTFSSHGNQFLDCRLICMSISECFRLGVRQLHFKAPSSQETHTCGSLVTIGGLSDDQTHTMGRISLLHRQFSDIFNQRNRLL